MDLIATGSALELGNLGDYEGRLDEGDRGLLELDLRWGVSGQAAGELQSRLSRAGVTDARVARAGSVLRIYWTKGFPWLAVIAAAIVAIIVLIILVVGFRLFREVAKVIPPVPLAIGLIVAAVLTVVVLSKQRR